MTNENSHNSLDFEDTGLILKKLVKIDTQAEQ